MEFTYNNSYHSSIGMTPYEALYNQRCRTLLCWFESGKRLVLGLEVVQHTTKKVKLIQEKMKVEQSRQNNYQIKHLRKYVFHPSHVIKLGNVQEIPLVKVVWKWTLDDNATWELES
ncbi:hypothetical protein CR513_29286, partial [Mucuna pruriens]